MLSAADLMSKLQLSRSAQASALQAAQAVSALPSAPSPSWWRGAAPAAPPAVELGGSGGDSGVSKPRRMSLGGSWLPSASRSSAAGGAAPTLEKAPTGFNSFMGEALQGWQQELLSLRLRQALIAEFIATALFVAVGLCTIMFTAPSLGGEGFGISNITVSGRYQSTAPFGGSNEVSVLGTALPAEVTSVGVTYNNAVPRVTGVAFSFGFVICCMVFSTGVISGGNLNPAVTLALYLQGKMSPLRCVLYITMQCTGAIAGAFYARSLSPDLFMEVGGGVNNLNPEVLGPGWGGSVWSALGAEICGTALLVFTVSAAADVGRERANKYVGALTPLMIGFAILVCHVALIPIDGCSLNPARSLGSAVAMNEWTNHYIFWVGPVLGGPLAAILYDRIFYTGVSDVAETVRPLDNLAEVLARIRDRAVGSSSSPSKDSGGNGGSGGGGAAAAVAAAAATGAASGAGGAGAGGGSFRGGAPRRLSRVEVQPTSSSGFGFGRGAPLFLPQQGASAQLLPSAVASAEPPPSAVGGSRSPQDSGTFSAVSPGALSQRQIQRRIK